MTAVWLLSGGWPKDVDFSEQADVTRFRKKAEKDEEYKVRAQRGGRGWMVVAASQPAPPVSPAAWGWGEEEEEDEHGYALNADCKGQCGRVCDRWR